MQNQNIAATVAGLSDLPKTLVLVLPGSLFGSAKSVLGYVAANKYIDAIARQILDHDGNFVVIDGFLSDEISRGFDDIIETGLSNAIVAATQAECFNSVSAVRMYSCDTGDPAYHGWEVGRSHCLQKDFASQSDAVKFLSGRLQTSAIEVTGAWATLDDSSGCVNHVAAVLRSHMPHISVRISETALFVEYEDGELAAPPIFNKLA